MMGDRGEAQGPKLETVLVGAVVLIALLAGLYLWSGRQPALRKSVAGLDGLQMVMAEKAVKTRPYFGDWPLNPDQIGLLVLPLYDTRLDQDRSLPENSTALLQQQDEYDLYSEAVLYKAEVLPALIVLPKWRSGLRLTRKAHPVLLVDKGPLQQMLVDLTGEGDMILQQSARGFEDFAYPPQGLMAQLYLAQTFQGGGCRPLIGSESRMVLGDCPLVDGGRVLILSDPDLMNNHGLQLGQNVAIVQDLLANRAKGGDVIVDYSPENWLWEQDDAPLRERSWSDLAQFFAPPFLAIWLGGAVTFLLFLWRAGLRMAPLPQPNAGQAASRMQAIGARARLMRRTGQDGPLLSEYATARIAATAARLVGPGHARLIGEERAFLRYVGRHHAARLERLQSVLSAIRQLPSHLAASDAIHHVDDLEQVLEQISHDT